ncbi:MAG: dihydropteroate synthase, partial [Bacteroidota bacterium]
PGGSVYGGGASRVDLDEELRRVVPVVEQLASRFPGVILSVDTYKPEVAERSLEAGAHVINDVTGLRLYPEMADVAARFGAPLIVMHSLGRPGEMPHEHAYGDVVSEVALSLRDAIRRAESAGVRDIVTDPGFGFGKSLEENLKLLRETRAFAALGRPVLVGISRKSTIGKLLAADGEMRPTHERLFGTLGATSVAALAGASIIRTHDVGPTVDFLRVLKAAAFEPSS